MTYDPVIGLEVHAQLLTDAKIFCGCKAAYGGAPNAHTCPVCLGLPGALPVLNRRAVEFAMRMILAVGGTVRHEAIFARKNYFYPDLPKGYQISQYDQPLGDGGSVGIIDAGVEHRIGLIRIHLEEDAGKSFHPENAGDDATSLVDMNRCGVPLIEIVSRPDIHSPRQAGLYLTRLKQILEYLEICTGNMEEGALRCDANVSIRPTGTTAFGTRTEVKNMNSIRGVERALAYEIERQTRLVQSGGTVVQETMLWDEKAQSAHPMRSKEESSDYRYFPEPDLLPLRVPAEWIQTVRSSLPELPQTRAKRLATQYGIPAYDAAVLTDQKALADYFEATVKGFADAKKASNWIMTEVLRILKDRALDVRKFPVTPASLAELLGMIDQGTISATMAKEVFETMVASGRAATDIVVGSGLAQISGDDDLAPLIDAVLADNPGQIEKYKGGKTQLFGFFVGETMKRSKGRANPQRVNDEGRDRDLQQQHGPGARPRPSRRNCGRALVGDHSRIPGGVCARFD
ncbi:MAG: Asp-tRNA(Asn)/Glu-tRNA(Gln) amidotransferase subunit GatB [candidate division Zixibacteria bacterium]|nr:Asp-tRNA(Asn)/Glu-tRNA(Gln) amidotransferase subunit GatB [candidate division Zixibacteria bacterium]